MTGPRMSKMSSMPHSSRKSQNRFQRIIFSPFPQDVFPLTFPPVSLILEAERSVTGMSSLLLRNLRSVITCDDGDTVLEHTDLYCEDGVIRAMGPDLAQTADTVMDGSRYWCYPGLINTHHHLYQEFSRNLPQVQNLELFDWLTALYEIWKGLDEDVVRLSSLTGMGELLKHGCTTCFDHHYVPRWLRGPDRHPVRRRRGAGHPNVRLPGQHGPLPEGRRPAAGQRGPDGG